MLLHHRLGRALVGAAVAAAFVMAVASPLSAQTTSASVAGSVKDAQSAVLPGATVTLTSVAQGTELNATTDELGNFLFPYVRPDTYTLTITLAGFQTVKKENVIVNANDRLTAGAFTLTIGQLSETVVVTGTSNDIQLRSGERAYTLQSVAMQNIAVNGRSFFGLAALVPGVVMNSDTPTQVSNLNANGQRSNSNNMTIDGVANIDTGDNGGNMAQTNIDAIAEFKVLTASYQAEYGRAVGAQVQVVTKSGGRNYSGSAYWYARRSDWNANTWINNRSGTPLAKSSRNDTGFTLGGPVIPKKNLFFFFSQEFQRREDPVGETRVTVPTDLERMGDFSQSRDANGNLYPYIRDYTTGLPCSATNTSGCFQDGGVLGKIPGEPPLRADARRVEHLPQGQHGRAGGLQLQEPDAVERAAEPDDDPDGLPDGEQLAVHRPLHVPHEQVRAALRHRRLVGPQQRGHDQRDLGRPGAQLAGIDDRHPQQHDVAGDLGGQRAQLAQPHGQQRPVHPDRRRHVEPADAVHDADPGGPRSALHLRRRASRQFTVHQHQPGAVHQLQHDV